MNKMVKLISHKAVAIAVTGALFMNSSAVAEDVFLRAEAFTKSLPDVVSPVTVWGYSECDATFTTCGAPSSPGPAITVGAGDTNLNITLQNSLTVDTSIYVPTANKSLSPATFLDLQGRSRIRSFDIEVSPGASQTYSWTNLRPGTHTYHSGSHVQLQVHMGLYGAVEKDAVCSGAGTSCVYPDVDYDVAQTLVFSEVDESLHDPATPANATVEGYLPRHFLINGEANDSATAAPVITVNANDRVLLRMVNSGLRNIAPQLLGGYFEIVGQDSHRSPTSRSQYNTLLPASKTLDVIFTPTQAGTYTLFDRRLSLVNGVGSRSGMLTRIEVLP